MKISNMSEWFLAIELLDQFKNEQLPYKILDTLLSYLDQSLKYMEEEKAEEELAWVCDNLRAFAQMLLGEGHLLASIKFWKSLKKKLWIEVFLHPPILQTPEDQDWNDIIKLD